MTSVTQNRHFGAKVTVQSWDRGLYVRDAIEQIHPSGLGSLAVLEKLSDTFPWPSSHPLLALNLNVASATSHPAAPCGGVVSC